MTGIVIRFIAAGWLKRAGGRSLPVPSRTKGHGVTPRICLVAVAACIASGPAFAADPLITGSAIYELELDPEKGGTVEMGDVSGQMRLSLLLDCKAYRVDASLDAAFSSPQGAALPMKMTSTLVEEGDTLHFDLNGTLAGVAVERAVGIARRTGDGLRVSLTQPTVAEKSFDGPVLFPVAMIDAVIAAARAGKSFADFKVFDGSGHGEEVWSVSVVIGKVPGNADLGEEALFAAGLGFERIDRWHMTFSYFPPSAGGEQAPAFSTKGIVYANGFTLASVYDLGPIALRLRLVEFKPIAPKPCA